MYDLLQAAGAGDRQDLLLAYANSLGVENKPPPPPVPMVPLNAAMLAANVAVVGYNAGNGGIVVQFADQRYAPVAQPGDALREATYEIGRFALTPRALRQLLDAALATAKAYESALGKPLPTVDQFNAAAAMSTLIQPAAPPPPSPEDSPPTE